MLTVIVALGLCIIESLVIVIASPMAKPSLVLRFLPEDVRLGKFIDLNGPSNMWLVSKISFYPVSECGTCGNSNKCDYCVVGCRNPLASEYQIVTDNAGRYGACHDRRVGKQASSYCIWNDRPQ